MITQNTPYHVGTRALVFMVLQRLKYPFFLAVLMAVISILMSWGGQTIALWSAGHSGFLNSVATGLYGLQKYGWILTIFLVVCFAILAILEYYGFTFTLSDQGLYVRTGIITHREIAIPYRQIQTINLVEHAMSQMFGLCSVAVITSATVLKKDEDESEATFPLIHKSLAQDLRAKLLELSGGNASK